MTRILQIVCSFVTLVLLLSCDKTSTPPEHFTDTFKYTDKQGQKSIFYGFRNLDSAKHWAIIEKKKILVIFSGYASMSNPDMEWRILATYGNDANVQNHFIIAWLPVDDPTTASDTSKTVWWYGKQRKLRSIGDQNKYLEETLFNASTQPLLGFMDSSGKPIGKTIGYTNDKKSIDDFIESGLK